MSECFNLWTSHSTIVAQASDGELVHIAQDLITEQRPVVVWRPSPRSANAVLIGPNPLGIPMRDITGLPIYQRLLGVALVAFGESVALSLTPGRYFCAPPVEKAADSARVVFGRTEPQSWEMFHFQEAPDLAPPPDLADVLATIKAFFLGPPTASRFPLLQPDRSSTVSAGTAPSRNWLLRFLLGRVPMQHNQSEPLRASRVADRPLVAQALYSVIPYSQRQEIAAALIAQDVAILAHYDGGPGQDPWLRKGLPDLRAWLDAPERRPVPIMVIGRELDVIAKAGLGGTLASLGHLSVATLRKMVAPRRTCCVIATARNEGLYFLEWIAHHKMLGFDHLFIYSNMNDDGSDDLLAALAAAGEISWIKNELEAGVSAQDKAYAHALSLLPDTLDFEWSAIIDLDEFVMLDAERFSKISEYIAWQNRKPTDALALGWLIYGANSQRSWQESPVVARFARPSSNFSHTVKTICRTNLFFHSQPHFPITDVTTGVRYRDSAGRPHVYDPNVSATAATEAQGGTGAYVAHYVFKSLDEYLWKCSRNRGNDPTTTGRTVHALSQDAIEAFVGTFEANVTVETSRSPAYLEDLGHEIARLRAIPGVAGSMKTIVAVYHERMPEIRRQFLASLRADGAAAAVRLADLIAPSV